MMKFSKLPALTALSLLLSSCSSLNMTQKQELNEWQAQNLKVESKNEGLAAALNVLPGIGDFYNGNIGLGIGNLLTWPLSILWAPVGGASGAQENNYYATKTNVDNLAKRRDSLIGELQAAVMTKQITNEEFFAGSQKVKSMSLSDFKNPVPLTQIIPRLGYDPLRVPSSNK